MLGKGLSPIPWSNENHWDSMRIKENQWESMKINENEWTWMKMNENEWQSLKSMKINENERKSSLEFVAHLVGFRVWDVWLTF